MKKQLDVTINDKVVYVTAPDEPHGLYDAYLGELRPQSLIIDVDEHDDNVVIDIGTDAIIGNGVPISVIHGVDIRYYRRNLPLTPNEAIRFVEEYDVEFKALVESHDVEWDGSNMRGTLTEAARAANEAIQIGWDCIESDHDFAGADVIGNEVTCLLNEDFGAIAAGEKTLDEAADEIRDALLGNCNAIADPEDVRDKLERAFELEKEDRAEAAA